MNLLTRSFQLDCEFMQLPLPFEEKVIFILKKYLILIKNIILGFKVGFSHIKIFGRNYFYYDKFGIAFLQSVFVENSYLASYIKPGSTIIDVGAHVGEFHIFCKRILKTNKIISIEPIIGSYSLLKRNIIQKPLNFAVSTKKIVTMYTPDTTIMSSTFKDRVCQATEKCQGIYLDNVTEIHKLKSVDLLKIDVEGAEYDVLQTAEKTIKKSKYLFVEVSLQRLSSGDIFDIMDKVRAYCPTSKVIHMGKPFIVSGKPMCIDILFKCQKDT